jgi:hypothetical protein
MNSNAFKDSDFFSTKGASHTSLGHRPDLYTQISSSLRLPQSYQFSRSDKPV